MQPQAPSQAPQKPGWQYTQEQTAGAVGHTATQSDVGAQPVAWSAPEFTAHHKDASWYLLLAGAGVVVVGLVYLLTKDLIASGTVTAMLVILAVFAGRQPRVLDYRIDDSGVHVGDKSYGYKDFKTFSIIDEGNASSLSLAPLKRFMPPISLYYDPKDEKAIMAAVSAHLPFVEGKRDALDTFMSRIRF